MPGEEGQGQQQAIQQYQQIQQQLQQVQDYIDQVEQSIEQVNETSTAAKDLKDEEVGSEMLVPLGSGVFAVGELKDTEKVVVNVGGDAFEKKEIDQARGILSERIDELKDTREELQGTVDDLQEEMQSIQQHLQQARQQQD
ncbi:MAG: prefoldin subunit alpha [Candidatus Nanohaloarchaea archaeon]